VPKFMRSDNGSEFIATDLKLWLEGLGIDTHLIDPGKPWQNGKARASTPGSETNASTGNFPRRAGGRRRHQAFSKKYNECTAFQPRFYTPRSLPGFPSRGLCPGPRDLPLGAYPQSARGPHAAPCSCGAGPGMALESDPSGALSSTRQRRRYHEPDQACGLAVFCPNLTED